MNGFVVILISYWRKVFLRKAYTFCYLHPDDLPEGLCFEEELIKATY